MIPRILLVLLALAGPPRAAGEPPLSALTLVGPPVPVFVAARDACDGADVPDAPARAFRDATGAVALYGLHYRNRALRGPDLDHLKIDCRVVLESGENPDPAAYDDRSWITATWTEDGKAVAALLHHEYQADKHPGRCRSKVYMECWYNTVLGASSTDGGLTFTRKTPPAVVAGPPFRQEVDQGRHRGFFNPSNIFADGRYRYVFASTTGWDGQAAQTGSDQPHGVCLFRTETPADPSSWRAWTGTGFTAAFPDPYRAGPNRTDTCKPIAPFPAPVGSVIRHRASGAFIAVFMAKAGDGFSQSGFYWTTSRDLLTWDVPRLLLAGATLYDDPCGAVGGLIAYPALLDPSARGQNFDDVGEGAELFYATLKTKGCAVTSEREMMRQRVVVKVWP